VRVDRNWIASHIPHRGSMCLNDEVLAWDASRIVCRSSTHRARDNPLRADGRLGAACGIEYAAQAMALHGALIASTSNVKPGRGYLASVRSVTLYVSHLDDVEADLVVKAERVAGDNGTLLYEFSVSGGEEILLNGRATIVLGISAGRPAGIRIAE
jgi:predicted hotdog family 3-hydroxylacyl-ACP dehydratase